MERAGTIARFAAIFAGGTLVSRALGLVRDMAVAALIPTVARDMFLFAFRFPNMLRDMFGEGAANAALIPVFSAMQEQEDSAAYREAVRSVLGAMVILFAVLTVLGVLALPYLPHALGLLSPLTESEAVPQAELTATIRVAQWTFPYLFLIGVAVFAMGPLFVARHYSTPSWSPALLNVALIACALGLHDSFANPAWALVIGVWVGGLAQLGAMFFAMYRVVGVCWPRFRLRVPAVWRVAVLLGPVIIGQAAGEVNKLVDNFFAYSLENGVVTALFYANRLVHLPLAIFGVAVSVAILPGISSAAARGDDDSAVRLLRTGFRQSFFLIAPAMAGLILLRAPIVSMLFERGAFDAADTTRTATALAWYATGLLSFAWVKVAVQGFYGQQRTGIPVAVASASMLLNIVLNVLLVGPLGYQGLAIATSISFSVNFLLLFALLCWQYGWLVDREMAGSLVTMTLAAVAMGGVLGTVQALCGAWAGRAAQPVLAVYVLACIGLALVIYFGIAWMLRLPEMHAITRRLRARGSGL